jgi:hypothetical protein
MWGQYPQNYQTLTPRFSWYKGITIFFLLLLVIAFLFFSIASIYDGMSRNTFGTGNYLVAYVVTITVCGLFTFVFYLLYVAQVENRTLLFTGSSACKQDSERGFAHMSYPRYTWDINTYFTATLFIFVFTVAIWGKVVTDVGYNYDPNFNLSINDENLLEFYFGHLSMVVLSLIAFALALDLLWILSVTYMYPIHKIEYIKSFFENKGGDQRLQMVTDRIGMDTQSRGELLRYSTPGTIFYPGTARRSRGKKRE